MNKKYQKRLPLQDISKNILVQFDAGIILSLKSLIFSIPEVYFRSGVWNAYKKISSKIAYEKAIQSPYGAELILVYDDAWCDGEVDGKLLIYITCPCESDMW